MEVDLDKNCGIVSLAVAGVAFLIMFFFFLFIIPFVQASYPSSSVAPAFVMAGVWLGLFIAWGMGIFCGLLGVFNKKMRGLSFLGLILNLVFLGVYVLGLKIFM
jgi:hypothetical protein